MSRRWRITIGVLAGLALLLTLNTIVTNRATKDAEVTVEGGKILSLPAGDLQVLDTGEPAGVPGRAAPVVLLHCFTCAIDWWDEVIPKLSQTRRVVAIDLLGHGGSEMPKSGYSMEDQAALVAAALNELGVEGATVVGHSLGATVATALAEQSRELVDRLVIIDQAPDNSFGGLDFLATLTFKPVIGQALWRTKMDWTVRDGLGEAFAPGFDVPDAFVEDLNRMTYTAYDESPAAEDDYTDERPLDERVTDALVPLMVIFGEKDQIYNSRESVSAYADVPGVRTELIPDAGHSPNVEAPEQVATLILEFSEPVVAPEPEPQPNRDRGRSAGNRNRETGGVSPAGGSEGGGSGGVTAPAVERACPQRVLPLPAGFDEPAGQAAVEKVKDAFPRKARDAEVRSVKRAPGSTDARFVALCGDNVAERTAVVSLALIPRAGFNGRLPAPVVFVSRFPDGYRAWFSAAR